MVERIIAAHGENYFKLSIIKLLITFCTSFTTVYSQKNIITAIESRVYTFLCLLSRSTFFPLVSKHLNRFNTKKLIEKLK